jgi:hypothetical protein
LCALDQADLDSAKCLQDIQKAFVLYHFPRPSASPLPEGGDWRGNGRVRMPARMRAWQAGGPLYGWLGQNGLRRAPKPRLARISLHFHQEVGQVAKALARYFSFVFHGL